MPMSHFGLTVSHIPSATSFYLSALQPLGYRFIGHQGDSIGLGIDSADFFLTQAPIGTRPSPNHIAFLADSRLVVRECYAAALNSGAHPSGSPRYRNDNCSCFNAAVEDLDGNTVEFIFRQPHGEGDDCDSVAPSEGQRLIEWQKEVPEGAPEEDQPEEDVKSQAESKAESLRSKASQAKSKLQTAMDLASTTSRSVRSAATSRGSSRTSSAPLKPDFPNKGLIGIALGAAAGAGLMYAMHRAESKNAQDEADHLAIMSSRKSRTRSTDRGSRPPPSKAETVKESSPPPKAESVKESVPPAAASNRESRRFHRNFSTTESAYSRRPPPPDTRAMRMIADTGYNGDDEDVKEAISRYTSLRPHATRNRDDETEYASASRPPRTEAPSGHSMKRASTLPVGAIEDRQDYYLEAPPARSSASRHSGRHGSVSGSHASHRNHRRSSNADADLKRHDSGISMHSSRSRRDRDSDAGRRSSAGTIKPARRDSNKYDDVQAAVEAAMGKRTSSKAPDSCYYPAAISLPASKVESKTGRDREDRGSKAPTHISNRDRDPPPPVEAVESKQSWEDFPGEESDGLGDIRTVMPDDSISCVDLSKRRRRTSHGSRHSSRRSEADSERTVRPARRERDDGGSRHSGTAIPHRSREEKGKRSILGFA